MSLLWPNQLQVALSSQGAVAMSLSARCSKNKLKQQYVPAIKNLVEPDWQAVSSSLETLLSLIQVKRNIQLTITLSSDFVRYQLLPAQQISMSSVEKMAYAVATYKEIYGSEVDGWKIKLHETGFNQASISAAIDEVFLAKLHQISQQYQIKLASVQPNLMRAYNSCSKQLSQLSGCFVVVESSKLILLDMLHGHCQHLRMRAIGNDWQQDLQQVLLRESMLNDSGGKDVLLHAPAHKKMIQIEGWQISLVSKEPQQIKSSSHSAMLEVPV